MADRLMDKHPAVGKLGLLPARRDSRTLKLSRCLLADKVAQLPKVPPLQVFKAVPEYPMYDNDQYGDCGPAAAAHMIQGWTYATGRDVTPPVDAVLAFYSAISGFDPATGANDNGVVLLDLLRVWANQGLAGDKVLAFVEVDVDDQDVYDWAACAFGGLLLGYQLPTACQDGRHWTFNPTNDAADPPESLVPGSWGGHAVCECENPGPGGGDENRAVVTWGAVMPKSVAFDRAYRNEA